MRTDYSPLDVEQYMMELVNRARLDPLAEASRQGIDLNYGIAPNSISIDTKQPLSFNVNLVESAYLHSLWMLDNDIFSHTGSGGSNPGARMATANYAAAGTFGWGENISWGGTTGSYDLNAFVKARQDGLFHSTSGHRQNMMTEDHKEVGFGIAEGIFTSSGTDYNAVMANQNFASLWNTQFLTGVRYNDADGDEFYTPGEGTDATSASYRLSTSSTWLTTDSFSSGGYNGSISVGNWDIKFSGGGLAADMEMTVTAGTSNVKIDLIGNTWIHSSADIVLGQNADRLVLLGRENLDATGNSVRNKIYGNKGDNTIYGEGGDDLIEGGRGNDTIFGGAGFNDLRGGSGFDTLNAGDDGGWLAGDAGNDTMNGGAGRDRAWGGDGDDIFLGGADNDQAKGNDGADNLSGEAGADILIGGNGIDTLNGGSGNDYLYGEAGDDFLDGGTDDDILNGGTGVDTFLFSDGGGDFGRDKVRGFENGIDIIDFSAVAAASTFAALNITDTAWGAAKIKFDASNLVYVEATLAVDLDVTDFLFT